VARYGLAVVEGRSMLPTLRPRDRVLVRYGGRPRVGRLAVVRLPQWSGETPVLAVKRLAHRDGDGWWVARDNALEGVDSWAVGAIPDIDVVATVTAGVWPPRTWLAARRSRPL
jgi:hypothetical protein